MIDLIDCTPLLRGTHPAFLLENTIVILRPPQLVVLRRFLDDLAEIGPGLNFVIERCIDENPGYNFSWDNDGTREQDNELDRRIHALCRDLGFIR